MVEVSDISRSGAATIETDWSIPSKRVEDSPVYNRNGGLRDVIAFSSPSGLDAESFTIATGASSVSRIRAEKGEGVDGRQGQIHPIDRLYI